ncbi:MAG: hypothetical protein II312_06135, partial [Lachnospiraceae bacterium]|nr:hypothetical protein [Lachnospiraceae bacterium]
EYTRRHSQNSTCNLIVYGCLKKFFINQTPPSASVLKVGHHGSDTSSSETFIHKASPRYSVISVGKDNEYGHPHEKVLYTLSSSTILRTDIMGTILIETDGEVLNVIN